MKCIRKVTLAALLALAGAAQATPMIRISDGSTTVTVADNDTSGACIDTNSSSGIVSFACSLGSWWLNAVIGVGHDVLGDGIHLNSLNLSSSSGGTISVALTDTDFVNTGSYPLLHFGGGIGGFTSGTVGYAMYVSDANTPFSLDTLIGSGGGASAFANSFSDWAAVAGTYSMTLVAQITHGSAYWPMATSIDFVGRVPEPATLGLLGLGLVGIGLAARRRVKV